MNNPESSMKFGSQMLTDDDTNFVCHVDGVTFGLVNGTPFDTGDSDWTNIAKAQWAAANALYFERIFKCLSVYSAAVASPARKEKAE